MDTVRNFVRGCISYPARFLNKITGGRLSPNAITLFGFAMHIPIALLIAQGYFIYGALLLAFFGLFDTLDGELARLQNRPSKIGMLLDSVTDKIKEVMLYVGIGYFFVLSGNPWLAVWAIAACGAALVVSYVNAWGEVVTKDIKTETHQTNKTFRSGIMTFDVRIFVIIVGLLFNQLGVAVIAITILGSITALQRLLLIIQKLR